MKILVERNQLVIPGDVLARGVGVKAGGGVYRRKMNNEIEICASMIGLAQPRKNRVGVVPLEGCYIPLEGDIVIGKIVKVGITSWNVDIRGPYVGTLRVNNVIDRDFDPLRENLDRILQIGDIIKAQITNFDRTRDPVLTLQGRGLRKISDGRLIEVDPVLKNMTSTSLIVGQNGRIVVIAPNLQIENLVERAIRKIELEAHTSGLTDRIRDFLEEEQSKLSERSD
jgi:exosome complex component RRP4